MDSVHVEYLHGHLWEYVLERLQIDDPAKMQQMRRMSGHHVKLRFEPFEYGFRKPPLHAGQFHMRTAGGFAAHRRGFAQAQDDGIRIRTLIYGAGNSCCVRTLDFNARRMPNLSVRQRRAQTLEHGHVTRRARRTPPDAAHLHRCIRQRANHGKTRRRS